MKPPPRINVDRMPEPTAFFKNKAGLNTGILVDFALERLREAKLAPIVEIQRVYCSIGTPSYISSIRRICVSRL